MLPRDLPLALKMEDSFQGLDLGLQTLSCFQKKANKKRFSDEQIKFLEYTFESESRPESRMKQQLATDLGLQPRQVAIWFQNRRARLKTKQIERDYSILKQSYDALASNFESLKRENQSLQSQLQKLKTPHLKQLETRSNEPDQTESSGDDRSGSKDVEFESKEKSTLLLEGCGHREDNTTSTDHNSISIESTGEESDILDLAEGREATLTSSDWHGFESNYLLEESTSSSQWWEFLS
ncbi:hypothetical protein Tsubulata_005943 [Turnera subulata]|uniref:Homeobox-leucine zipper protein n=1 Tax=Turnera subulata TaxID=218843 RepID=A0A9Q0JMQ4_9ROSI|nr:hypothetical protein Tsubulata_005943 [Turnera subulata]